MSEDELQTSASAGLPAPPGGGDFGRLRAAGLRGGASLAIGARIAAARDALARGLLALGLTPNHLSVTGLLLTVVAGVCLARGASHQVPYFSTGSGPTSWWPTLATLALLLAGACDMLDGALARVGNLKTRFGAILDSTLDRFGDMAIFLGCALHFALQGNLTAQALALVALCGSFLISYVKARAEQIIPDCSVGYWLRGERFAAILIGCATGHVLAMLWQLAVLSLFTVWRRIDHARRAARALPDGPLPPTGPGPGLLGRLRLWRYPRGSIPYDIVTGMNIAYLIAAPWFCPVLLGQGQYADPLRNWLAG